MSRPEHNWAPGKETLARIRAEYPVGTRVVLTFMDDPQAPPIGTGGTVTGVDDIGSLLVHWDNGSTLNVLFGEDCVDKVEDKATPQSGAGMKIGFQF